MTIRINNEIIPEDAIRVELLRLIRFYSEHAPQEDVKVQVELLLEKAKEQAVGAKLMLSEARRLKLTVSDEEADARMRKIVEKCGSDEDFCAMLDRQGLSEDALRRSIVSGMQVDKLVAQVTSGLPEPSDDEARKYYERHQADLNTVDRVDVRHILIKPGSQTDEDRAIARAKLMGLKRQVEEGADFARLARVHSECPSGRKSDGRIGWVNRGAAIPAFDQILFSMGVGEVSGVVETPLGYHILQATDREEGRLAEYEAVRDQIFDIIRHSRRGKAISDFVARLKAQAVIEDDGEEISLEDLRWEGEEG